VSPDSVTVAFDQQAGCEACFTGVGCGLGPILRLFARAGARTAQLPSLREGALLEGDRVRVTVSGGRLAALAAAAYGLPVVGVMIGAGIAAALLPERGDAATVGGALTGAALAWLWLRLGGIGRAVTHLLRSAINSSQ